MNTFKLGGIELGVGHVLLEISEEDLLINLEIEADENHPWKTLLYPPLVYFYDVGFSLDEIIVISPFHNKEIALDMWEHFDFNGTLAITDKFIEIKAIVEKGLPKSPLSLEIWIERKSL